MKFNSFALFALSLSLSLVAATAGTDKSLVSWVALANTTQQGGSALTMQRGEQFDGIVFGEITPGKWMVGSENFARTQRDLNVNAAEKADDTAVKQVRGWQMKSIY